MGMEGTWMRASTASMSRWLDGSSRSRMCGFVHVTRASATRDFCNRNGHAEFAAS